MRMAISKILAFVSLSIVKAIVNGMMKKNTGTISMLRAIVKYVKKQKDNRFNCLYLVAANGSQTCEGKELEV